MLRVKWDIPKMLQNVPCTMSHISWKFNENPYIRFFRNVANRQTDRQADKGEKITFAMVEVITYNLDKIRSFFIK